MAKPSPAQLRRSGVQAFMGSGVRGSGGGSGYQGITKRVRRYKGVRGSWVQGSGGHRGYKGIRGSGGGSGCQKIRGQGVYKGFIGSGVHGFRGQEVMGSGGQGVNGSCIIHTHRGIRRIKGSGGSGGQEVGQGVRRSGVRGYIRVS